mmetsp:Transcript_4264/g.12428  ORF Transcript_4264/g.12428 Transcript_4264/m.12428 type:complete len:93 (+) Transcript_4264:105-383(+)
MAGEEDERVLVVFDYDWSLINENSDTFVVQQLAPGRYGDVFSAEARQGEGWTATMDRAMGVLHSEGKTSSDIVSAVGAVPHFPEMPQAVQVA